MKLNMTGIELLDYLQKKMGVKNLDVLDVGDQRISRGDIPSGLFTVFLTGFGQKKIGVIKIVREITGLGLKEAKDLVEHPIPQPITVNRLNGQIEPVSQEVARKLKSQIEAAGGTVQLRQANSGTPIQQDRDCYLVTFTDSIYHAEKREIVIFAYNREAALDGAREALNLHGGSWVPEYRILPSVGRPF